MKKMVNFNSNKLLKLFIVTIGVTSSITAYGADDSEREARRSMMTTGMSALNSKARAQIQAAMSENSAQVAQLRTTFAQNAERANAATSSDVPQNEEVIAERRAAVFITTMQTTIKLESSVLSSTIRPGTSTIDQSDMLIKEWSKLHEIATPRPYQIDIIRAIYKDARGHVPTMKFWIGKATTNFDFSKSSVSLILHTHKDKLYSLLDSFLNQRVEGFHNTAIDSVTGTFLSTQLLTSLNSQWITGSDLHSSDSE
jgi:hypothetical protein